MLFKLWGKQPTHLPGDPPSSNTVKWSQHLCLLILPFPLPFGNPREPIKSHSGDDIESDKGPQDAEIAPAILIASADAGEEDIGVPDGAVAAGARRVGVHDIAADPGNVLCHVVAARGALGRSDGGPLVARARHVDVGEPRGQDGRDPIRDRRQTVQEDPEPGHGVRWGQDAAEEEDRDEQQIRRVTAGVGGRCPADAEVCKGRGEEEKLPEQKPHQHRPLRTLSGDLGVVGEAHGVVDQCPHEHGCENGVGELGDDLTEHEDLPRVRLGRALSGFVQRALLDEMGHLLVHQL